MKNGFEFKFCETNYQNCFIEYSTYLNGNLKLSLYGLDPKIKQIAHLLDITLENNKTKLPKNQIIVNHHFRPTLVKQLENLGILKEKIGMCVINNTFYPIYTINFSKVLENCYYLQDLVAA